MDSLIFQSEPFYDSLKDKQKSFYKSFFNGKNIFLTGAAGTGKSYVVQKLIEFSEQYSLPISKTASTGIAAINIKGTTIHSFMGIGLAKENIQFILDDIETNPYKKKVLHRIKNCKILIIDEISMLSGKIISMIDIIFRKIKDNKETPFGGVQMILVGDPLQLPTIDRNTDGINFFFKSNSFKNGNFTNIVLNEIVRQKDELFAKCLDSIRTGIELDLKPISSRLNITNNSILKPLKIKSLIKEVEYINNLELSKLKDKEVLYTSIDYGDKKYIDFIENNSNLKRVLKLKRMAQVVLTSNLDVENGLVNGSMGIVVDFTPSNNPIVQFSGKRRVEIEQTKIEHKEEIRGNSGKFEYKVIAGRTQYPLKLGWANTVHSVQGMTLDSVEVDLNNIFEDGQAYVALSRCKTLEGMYVICEPSRFKKSLFRPNKEALEFYKNIIE